MFSPYWDVFTHCAVLAQVYAIKPSSPGKEAARLEEKSETHEEIRLTEGVLDNGDPRLAISSACDRVCR